MKIFLIAGKAGSGKKEVAKLIKEYYIYKLKECALTSYSKYINEFTMELTDWDGYKEKPRTFMQQLGDNMRDINPNFFTSRMIQDIQVYERYVEAVVINDVRMPEEIDQIKDNFDDVCAIYVVNQFGNSKLSIEEQAHKSETALEDYTDFDYTIANDTLENLKSKVFKILDGFYE